MDTAQEIYSKNVLSLPASERLRLATMILDDLSRSSATALDFSDHWTEEDVRDLAAFAAKFANGEFEKE